MREIQIRGRTISRYHRPYTIAEAGINHNGSLKMALEMVGTAKRSGADAIKFQTFKADEFCNPKAELYQTFKQCELKIEDWKTIKRVCDQLNLTFLSTPQNYSDLEILLKLGVKAIKVGSDDLTNLPLLKRYAETRLPIIVGCGMSYQDEIDKAVLTIRGDETDYPIILLHCTSLYPTMPDEVNMKKMDKIRKAYPNIILGYSDHTIGNVAAVLGVGFGGRVFETHFTMSNTIPGPDQKFSKNPTALKSWIDAIQRADKMMGHAGLKPTKNEENMRKIARRSVTAVSDIKKGDKFTNENTGMMRPGDGLQPEKIVLFLGQEAIRDILRGEKLQNEDIDYGKGEKNIT
jgi:N-acetylneuraminate synthase/N,N'-diacetyllegionaminate synthase